MAESSTLNHLYSQQLYADRLRDAEQHRLERLAEGNRKSAVQTGLGRLRKLFESTRRPAARPSLTAAR